ncbi:MAG: GNAT family N-acetyltransferase [Eubacterium sp.]|nr:GNAT family N-acetyltransferase [Eubacterium sp.]
MQDRNTLENFEFRTIVEREGAQAAAIEQVCFLPREACDEKSMVERVAAAPELFLVAIDKKTGLITGFLNGIATDEDRFRDEFFTDAALHHAAGKNIMLLGLDVLPDYRHLGLAKALTEKYLQKERERGREKVFLTCAASKVKMYEKFGFVDLGISDSAWGGEVWHEMCCDLGNIFD